MENMLPENQIKLLENQVISLMDNLDECMNIFNKGYELCKTTLNTLVLEKVLPKDKVKSFLENVEEKSKKIRNDAIEKKINFEEIREWASLLNKEQETDNYVTRIKNIERESKKLSIKNDILKNYETIVKSANLMNIQETDLIVQINMNQEFWQVINKSDNKIIYKQTF